MTTDAELLRQFAATRSEAAFAELVRRHVNLVYSAALRQANGDAHLAQDVAQTVFNDLARKAGSLACRETLTGWLYTSAHFAAAKIVRGENRRRDREEKFMREPTSETAPDTDWEKLRPTLDDAMHELKETDREAILLRYFENRQFAEVGAKLGLNENAARMRVERALEKLRTAFARRGVAATAALASVISANAVQMAPANLAVALTTASITIAGTGTTFTLMKIMTATKLKLAFSALVVVGATTAIVVQHQTQEKLRAENAALAQQVAQLQTDNENLSNRLAASGDSKSLSDKQFNELLKLRGEVGVLRQQINELGRLREENRQLQTSQRDASVQQQAIIDAEEQQQKAAIQKLNDAKQGVLAFIMFASDNHEEFPTNFAQASRYMKDDYMNQIETNFDMLYQGSIANIANPSATIVLKEKQAWQALNGKWMKTYGFADGHAEVHTEPDGNFDGWESQRIISPPNQ
ncbi:MAG: sigma-70 family RNA polymerase sigma factor [Verrucomicrobiales bacterium]|nr:sigma-70 family RNA polymerase sigma factor [Verrucomicrobiales bacterium]